jgi:hypothetical protein
MDILEPKCTRYFKALYHRIARRRGKQRAAVALARSILQVA